jgi:hypothetical protein
MLADMIAVHMRMRERRHALQKCKEQQQKQAD